MASVKDVDILSHHAYLIVGGDSVKAELISMLEKNYEVKIHSNPDFFDRVYETFTIDDARELKSLANMRPVTDSDKKIFILMMNGITVEAQNALLKLLEEPPEYVHFFLIIPSAHLLLPTVKSRMSMIDAGSIGARGLEGKGNLKSTTTVDCSGSIGGHGSRVGSGGTDKELIETVKKFVTSPKPKRLEQVKSLMEAISKEKKTKQDAIDFINVLEAAVYSNGGVKKNVEALKSIELARKYMNDRSPSMKMLLEYVALNI
jgi:DNA polymerase III delta prime subunit